MTVDLMLVLPYLNVWICVQKKNHLFLVKTMSNYNFVYNHFDNIFIYFLLCGFFMWSFYEFFFMGIYVSYLSEHFWHKKSICINWSLYVLHEKLICHFFRYKFLLYVLAWKISLKFFRVRKFFTVCPCINNG